MGEWCEVWRMINVERGFLLIGRIRVQYLRSCLCWVARYDERFRPKTYLVRLPVWVCGESLKSCEEYLS